MNDINHINNINNNGIIINGNNNGININGNIIIQITLVCAENISDLSMDEIKQKIVAAKPLECLLKTRKINKNKPQYHKMYIDDASTKNEYIYQNNIWESYDVDPIAYEIFRSIRAIYTDTVEVMSNIVEQRFIDRIQKNIDKLYPNNPELRVDLKCD